MVYMDETIFEKLSEKYGQLISELINTNSIYTNINETIKWAFAWDENPAITGAVNRETNIMSINVVFVDRAYKDKRIFDIEYFLLHEMRHIYQHIQIERYSVNKNTIDPAFILKWIEEGKNYIKALDENGNENPNYFKQDCEFDAYAFSYAVMNHKYSERINSFLFIPSIYENELKKEFKEAVNDFLNSFK